MSDPRSDEWKHPEGNEPDHTADIVPILGALCSSCIDEGDYDPAEDYIKDPFCRRVNAAAGQAIETIQEMRDLLEEAAAEITRLREELEKAQSWSRLWYETAMEYYPPNWATDGTPKNVIGNIVRYTESREAARLAAWKAEAKAWRQADDCDPMVRGECIREARERRAATDAIEKNAN